MIIGERGATHVCFGSPEDAGKVSIAVKDERIGGKANRAFVHLVDHQTGKENRQC